jgi:indolepyruvate ferredoxin oxidoreductase
MISENAAPGTCTLDDRYAATSGTVYLNGVQALVRLPIEQMRRDHAAGLRTRAFITGYPGSPLGGYDLALRAAGRIVPDNGILHVPGQNEELAATALSGTQMLDDFPHGEVDGVVGMWYGKGPGVDRSGDAFKHGNFAGTSRLGAVVVLSGEDHEGKSSTVPIQDDFAFESAGIPILYPSTVAEVLAYGLHAVALSRFSGCWVALKLVGSLCDGGDAVAVSPHEPAIVVPTVTFDGKPFAKYTDFKFFPGANLGTERHLYRARHAAVRAYARANGIDRIVVRSDADRLGIVMAGKTATDTRQALIDFGLSDTDLQRAGIRLLKIGLIYPSDDEIILEFAAGLDEVIVVEEKRGFTEARVRAALAGASHTIRIVGKNDEFGEELFPVHGGMDSDLIARLLAPRLAPFFADRRIAERIARIDAVLARDYTPTARRTPNYCSGCPHSISTTLPPGHIAWGSPGCHAFASLMEQPERHIEAMTQLGGEGLPWIGLAPFTDQAHMIQNVGDGSLFHSSYLNIRFAVAAGVNLTYKILFNGAVANTGAQAAVGGKSVVELAQLLAIEGVARIVIATQERATYRHAALPPIAEVRDVADFVAIQEDLAAMRGVTILIYDGTCSNERRRQEKRKLVAPPTSFVVINEDVCDNCGHCGALTNCMSLQKIDTAFGPKTQVHQSSCNHDRSCLGGDCPSFVTVETAPGNGLRQKTAAPLELVIPEPALPRRLERPYHVYVPGVGGTGVLTLNAILCHAAVMDGRRALSYDQTGAAQKWGPVLSSLIIAEADHRVEANTVGLGKADLYLALDLLAGADARNLNCCDPERTAAVINTSLLPSGEMIRDVHFDVQPLVLGEAIARYACPERTIRVDARAISEGAFGDYMVTNVVVLGAAYQAGFVPISAASIEAAIRLNGVSVETNVLAFRYGRLLQHDPQAVRALIEQPERSLADRTSGAEERLRTADARRLAVLMERCAPLPAELQAIVRTRIVDLMHYQNAAYAAAFVADVLAVAERERGNLAGDQMPVAGTFATSLHKLLAYKDEYEVARLHVDATFRRRTQLTFTAPATISYMLHPPLLRALGLKKKLRLGPWFFPFLRILATMKPVRGTPFDCFGYAPVRRTERRLVSWYRDAVHAALDGRTAASEALVHQIASLPEEIRGYEDIKLENARVAQRRALELLDRIRALSPAAV